MLKDKLAKVITTKPDTIQFVKDRIYEESWIIPLTEDRPSDQKINEYLAEKEFKLIIVEYIWNSKDDDNRFVLTLFLDKTCQLKDPKKFIDICLNFFYNYSSFQTLIDSLNSQVIGKPYIFEFPVETINLGVFNYWLSVGPVELWQQGDIYNKDEIVKRIKARPEVEKTNLNYQGLFFRFNVSGKLNGPHFGIKTPCCKKIGDAWVINFDLVDYWIKLFLR